MAASHDDWRRLAKLLKARRFSLDLRYAERGGLRRFGLERGIKYRTAWDIEKGERDNYEDGTKALIENAYLLAPGNIDEVLAGGELRPLDEAAVGPVPADAPEVVRQNWQHEAVRKVWVLPLPEDMRLSMIAAYLDPAGQRRGAAGS